MKPKITRSQLLPAFWQVDLDARGQQYLTRSFCDAMRRAARGPLNLDELMATYGYRRKDARVALPEERNL